MKEVMGILIMFGLPVAILLFSALAIVIAVAIIWGGFFGIAKSTKNLRKKPGRSIFFILISLLGIFAGLYSMYFIATLRSRWNNVVLHSNEIDSFAGCGRNNHDSYAYKTEEEIDRILKILNVSKKEFEKKKEKCIKSTQLSAFAGCKDEKYSWKRWDEMNEQELGDAFKYFDVSEETFNNIKKLCENHNQYVK